MLKILAFSLIAIITSPVFGATVYQKTEQSNFGPHNQKLDNLTQFRVNFANLAASPLQSIANLPSVVLRDSPTPSHPFEYFFQFIDMATDLVHCLPTRAQDICWDSDRYKLYYPNADPVNYTSAADCHAALPNGPVQNFFQCIDFSTGVVNCLDLNNLDTSGCYGDYYGVFYKDVNMATFTSPAQCYASLPTEPAQSYIYCVKLADFSGMCLPDTGTSNGCVDPDYLVYRSQLSAEYCYTHNWRLRPTFFVAREHYARNISSAEDRCQRQNGARLASIHSQADVNAILRDLVYHLPPYPGTILPGGAYIGLCYNWTLSNWQWLDGSNLDFDIPIVSSAECDLSNCINKYSDRECFRISSLEGFEPWTCNSYADTGNYMSALCYGLEK